MPQLNELDAELLAARSRVNNATLRLQQLVGQLAELLAQHYGPGVLAAAADRAGAVHASGLGQRASSPPHTPWTTSAALAASSASGSRGDAAGEMSDAAPTVELNLSGMISTHNDGVDDDATATVRTFDGTPTGIAAETSGSTLIARTPGAGRTASGGGISPLPSAEDGAERLSGREVQMLSLLRALEEHEQAHATATPASDDERRARARLAALHDTR